MRAFRILILSLVVMAIVSCIRRPDGILSDKEMAPIIADMELAEAYVQTLPPNKLKSSREAVVNEVLAKHNITRAQFDTTMAWYGRNMDEYYQMLNLVDKELAKRKSEIAGSVSVEVETSDLWPYKRQAYMSSLSGSDAFVFSVPTSDVQKGQRVNLKYRLNNPASVVALLGVEYETGEKTYLSRNYSAMKRVDLTLQTDSNKVVSRIFGNMLLQDRNSVPLWLDSISLKALPYDSMEYFKLNNQRIFK